jgi:hypothetical protein
MWNQVCLPRATGESAAAIAQAQRSSLFAGGVTCSAAEVERPTVAVTQPHLCRCLAEQPQNGCATDLTTAFDGGSGRAGEPRCLRDRLAALRARRMRRLWIPYGTTLILGRFVLPFCLFEHGGFGVDDHLVHLGFISRWRLAQETLCHQDERVSLGTLLWFVAG